MASVATPIVFVIFGLYRLISIPVNFSSMVWRKFRHLRNFRWFCNFRCLVEGFHYLIFISLLLFVDGPAKVCNYCYFRCFPNNCTKFWVFSKFCSTADLSPLLWPRGWALFGEERWLQGARAIDRYLVVFVVFFYNLQVTHLSLVNCSKVYEYIEKYRSIQKWVFCVAANKKRSSEIFSFLIMLGQEASLDSFGESCEGKGKFSGIYGAVWSCAFLQRKKI